MAFVRLVEEILLGDWLKETRPARAGVELGIGREQRKPAASAGVDARLLLSSNVPKKGRSVPELCRTRNCSGVRRCATLLPTASKRGLDGPDELSIAIEYVNFGQ